MGKHLVIVESPAKAKTIEKFLGNKKYTVKASVGHIRDLPKSKLGVEVENDFEPQYITIRGKGELAAELKKEAKKAERIFLATDQDREGEAISWHLSQLLKLDKTEKNRIEFNEITKDAIRKAIKSPRGIDMDLVDAQQARRVIDRLVGYTISPILWAKVRKGLSAGRVQSVTTKLICDKEKEIRSFIPEEYWSIEISALGDNKKNGIFKYWGNHGKKGEIHSQSETGEILKEIINRPLVINKIDQKPKRRTAPKPFTTSLLQQESASKLSFPTKKTMSVAQQLYEGIAIKGEGSVGLITYMRTDSQRISQEALDASEQYILNTFGKSYYKKYVFQEKKTKKIQDAHECIRPTGISRTPESIKDSLSKDQFKLYKLIWERFIAASMASAIFDTQSISGDIAQHTFKASGSLLKFDGFLKVYSYSKSEEKDLPLYTVNKEYKVTKILDEQHFTQPPSRYTEGSLVKALEELGIGRPSTYAPTIATILQRGYVRKKESALIPTELGEIVTGIMEENFGEIVDMDFTAQMEKELDQVEDGEESWKNVVSRLYTPLEEAVEKANEVLEKIQMEEEPSDEICDLCGSAMVIRHGRFGKFIACKNYPECNGKKPLLDKIGMKCPVCQNGEVIIRRSKKGRLFYGCSAFPSCRFVSWNKPSTKPCPICNSFMTEKEVKEKMILQCSNKECNHKE